MRKILSLALIAIFGIAVSPLTPTARLQETAGSSGAQQRVADDEPLTNNSITELIRSGLSPEVVVAKIRTTPNRFDTSPAALQALNAAGIPNPIILAMVEASARPNTAASSGAPSATVEVSVPDGTPVEIELSRTASGQELRVGDIVDFTVVQPVQVNGVTVIERGASARARVTEAKRAGRWGRAGKLEWAMQDVLAANGVRVPMRFSQRAVGESRGGQVAVAAVATTVLLGPLGLLWGLRMGRPAIIPAGNRYTIFVQGNTMVRGTPAPAATGQATPEQAAPQPTPTMTPSASPSPVSSPTP